MEVLKKSRFDEFLVPFDDLMEDVNFLDVSVPFVNPILPWEVNVNSVVGNANSLSGRETEESVVASNTSSPDSLQQSFTRVEPMDLGEDEFAGLLEQGTSATNNRNWRFQGALQPPAMIGRVVPVPVDDAASEEISVHFEALKTRTRQINELCAVISEPGTKTVAGEKVHMLESNVRSELSEINRVLESSILRVEDLFSALNLKDRYTNVLHKCEVLEHETQQQEDDLEDVPVADLVTLDWVDQPLPRSFKNKNRARTTGKKKKGHCTMRAELFCAPGVKFTPTSPVTAHFYVLSPDGTEELSDVQIQNNTEKLRGTQVSFDFRFPAGTRNRPCCIRLHVKGTVARDSLRGGGAGNKRVKGSEVTIISEPTHPFIITTNESQYESAELKLMSMELFEDGRKDQCSWAHFVNCLNVRWMRVTRQESENGISAVVSRRLSASDIEYFAHFFRDAPNSVSRVEFEKFYDFWGKVTHVYRHNVQFRQLLMDGGVWGFMSKDQSVALLSPQPSGSFVIRASEASPGSFCVSWKHDDGSIRHARVDNKILMPPVSNLAEYLMGKNFLTHVVQPFVYENGQVTWGSVRRSKDEVFGVLCATVKPNVVYKRSSDGYCDLNDM